MDYEPFNPDEPLNSDGIGGGLQSIVGHPEEPITTKPLTEEEFINEQINRLNEYQNFEDPDTHSSVTPAVNALKDTASTRRTECTENMNEIIQMYTGFNYKEFIAVQLKEKGINNNFVENQIGIFSERTYQEYKNFVNELEKYCHKSDYLKQDTILWKGTELDRIQEIIERADNNNISDLGNFTSTSFSKRVTERFGDYQLKIYAPKGTEGLAMHPGNGLEMGSLSLGIIEREYLFSGKNKIYILNHKDNHGNYILENNTLEILILK